MGDELALYLYGFARRNSLPVTLDMAGVSGETPVACQPHRDIVAAVSKVPLAEFTGRDAEARLSEIAWVGPRALRHEAVVEEIMKHSPILPARFGTLFSGAQRLQEAMSEHYDEIVSFLERTADQQEWAIKGYLDRRQALEAWTDAQMDREWATAESPGKRFLKRQRVLSQAAGRVSEWTEAARERLRRELQGEATSLVERAAGAPSEDQREAVLNFAVLVSRAQLPAVLATVEKVNADWEPRGLSLQCTGPLPPYSFTPALESGP
jgi:hypothetical protein